MIRWRTSPTRLAENVDELVDVLQSRIGQALADIGVNAEATMKSQRPWRDITGNARRGLRVRVKQTSPGFIMYFIHSAEYGVYLELKNNGRYAILFPTMRTTVEEIKAALRGIM
jgi:hypothetical protein